MNNILNNIIGIIIVSGLFYFMIKIGYDGITFKDKLRDFYGDLKSVFNFNV